MNAKALEEMQKTASVVREMASEVKVAVSTLSGRLDDTLKGFSWAYDALIAANKQQGDAQLGVLKEATERISTVSGEMRIVVGEEEIDLSWGHRQLRRLGRFGADWAWKYVSVFLGNLIVWAIAIPWIGAAIRTLFE